MSARVSHRHGARIRQLETATLHSYIIVVDPNPFGQRLCS
jgi:hypothetical protein